MEIPQIVVCKSFADLPAMRAGGVVYVVRDGADGGVGTYFAAKGWQVQDWVVTSGALRDLGLVRVRVLPEATRLVVAVGGQCAMQVGKQLATVHGCDLWCMPTTRGATGALWCYAMWQVDKHPAVVPTSPHTVLLVDSLMQEERAGIQQAYQCLLACYVALVCDVFRARMAGEEQDNEARRQCARSVHDVLMGCEEYAPRLGAVLWDALWQAAQHTANQENALFAWMICLYKGQDFEYNKYMCAAAMAVAAALAEWPDMPDLYLPPDRHAMGEGLAALGLTCASRGVQPPPHRNADWAWRDYLADVGAALSDVETMARRWRRLVGAEGEPNFEALTPQDLVALLPMVAEVGPAYTPLKHLYLRGGLNLFI